MADIKPKPSPKAIVPSKNAGDSLRAPGSGKNPASTGGTALSSPAQTTGNAQLDKAKDEVERNKKREEEAEAVRKTHLSKHEKQRREKIIEEGDEPQLYYRLKWFGKGGILVVVAFIIDIVDLICVFLDGGTIIDEILDFCTDFAIPLLYARSGVNFFKEESSLFPIWVGWLWDLIVKAIPVLDAIPLYGVTNVFILHTVQKNDKKDYERRKEEAEERKRQKRAEEARRKRVEELIAGQIRNEEIEEDAEERRNRKEERRNQGMGVQREENNAYQAYQDNAPLKEIKGASPVATPVSAPAVASVATHAQAPIMTLVKPQQPETKDPVLRPDFRAPIQKKNAA